MVRTFIAVKMSEPFRRSLGELIDRLRDSRADVKWVAPENLHLTLKFLGDVEEERLAGITDRVSSACKGIGPFRMSLAGLGAFPSAKRPSVIWVGVVQGKDELVALNDRVEKELEACGFEREKRRFSPHLTIGRVRRGGRPGDLSSRLDLEYSGGDSTVDKVFLVKSTLTPKGPIYEDISETKLE